MCCSASCCHMGIRDHEAWTAAKAAVEGLHRSAAATYVRQVCVC